MSVVMITKRNHATDFWQWQIENLDLQLNFDATKVSAVGQMKSDVFKAAAGTRNESQWKIVLKGVESYDSTSKKIMPLTFQVGLEFLGTPDGNDETRQIESIEQATAHYEIKLRGDEGEFFNSSDTATFMLRRMPQSSSGGYAAAQTLGQNPSTHFLDVMPFNQLSAKRHILFGENKLSVSIKMTLIFDNVHIQQTLRPIVMSPNSSSKGKKNLGQCLGQLVGQQRLSDMQILCGGQKFFAHRVILSVRSPILCSLLDDPNVKQIKIDDIDVATLERMLKYIYTDDDNVDNLTAEATGVMDTENHQALIKLLDCAEKYCLVDLKAACLEKICGILNDDNAAKFALIAYKYRAGTEWMTVIQGYCLRRHGTLIKNANYREIYCQNPEAFVGDMKTEDI